VVGGSGSILGKAIAGEHGIQVNDNVSQTCYEWEQVRRKLSIQVMLTSQDLRSARPHRSSCVLAIGPSLPVTHSGRRRPARLVADASQRETTFFLEKS